MTGVAPTGMTGTPIAPTPVLNNASRTAPTGVTEPSTQASDPQWRDLIVDPDTGAPEITRMQILLFTVVGAGFVLVRVLNYYVIPDIPPGHQILIGKCP